MGLVSSFYMWKSSVPSTAYWTDYLFSIEYSWLQLCSSFQDCFGYLRFLWSHMHFNIFFCSCKNCHWNPDRNFIDSIDGFGWYGHFSNYLILLIKKWDNFPSIRSKGSLVWIPMKLLDLLLLPRLRNFLRYYAQIAMLQFFILVQMQKRT